MDINFLSGIADYYTDQEIKELGLTETKDLGKTNKKSVYEIVNDILINELNKGILPWRKPWDDKAASAFTFTGYKNLKTKRAYNGINNWLIAARLKPHHKPFFLSQKQIEDKGGKINSGATRFMVVYFGKATKVITEDPTPEKPEGDKYMQLIRFLKEYTVYNVADTDLKLDAKDFEPPKMTEKEKIENCEKVYQMYPNKPPLKHGGNRAFYQPAGDFVQMPPMASFKKEQEYYCTLFHELIHSTGHAKRLKRDFSGRFGNSKYAFEELIAEIGASYICAHTGILFVTRSNSAAYLNSWMRGLAQEAKDNKTFFFKAASQSQKAANYILSKQLEQLKKSKKKKGKKAESKEQPQKASLSGAKNLYKKTNIKALKAKLKKLDGLGKLMRISRRNFEPETLTDFVAEFMLGRRVKKESFYRFGDRKHTEGKSGRVYNLHWFGNKGLIKERNLDQLAMDFMNEYPWYSNMDEGDIIQEMVELITNYPSGAGAYMDDRNREKQYANERQQEYFEHLEKENEKFTIKPVVKKPVKKTGKKAKSKIKQAPTKQIYSNELSIIRRFVLLDNKQVGAITLKKFIESIKGSKASNLVDSYKSVIDEIKSKINKAYEVANGSSEGKVNISLQKEFKDKCKALVSGAKVKFRTEYLAGVASTDVFIDFDKNRYFLIDLNIFELWANEFFKTKEEAQEFCKKNKLTPKRNIQFSDGFRWKLVTKKEAKQLYNSNQEVYGLRSSESEALIENKSDFNDFSLFAVEDWIDKSKVDSIKKANRLSKRPKLNRVKQKAK